MHSNLAHALVSKGVIAKGTIIEAYQKVRSLSCICDSGVIASFVVRGARLIDGSQVVFDTIGPEQCRYEVQAEQVVMIDGMAISRIALSHNLHDNGTEMAEKSRRGRRRKQLIQNVI
jgi:hypothetical protein